MHRKIAAWTLAIWGALSLALAHDPRTTAKDFSHGLKIEGAGDLSFVYKAMHFNETTYKRMQSEAAFRDRLNAKVWSSIGSVTSDFEWVLGDQKISLASFLQHEVDGGDAVPLVLTTHLAREGAIQTALNQINALPTITAPCVCLRIIDQPKEFAQA